MNPPESRKQLLIAESEFNRMRMLEKWQAVSDGVGSLINCAKSCGSIASSAAVLVAGLAAFRRGKSVIAAAKLSWRQTLLKGVRMISSLWPAFRSQRCDQRNK